MASDISVTSLTAAAGVGQITLAALTAAPDGMGCLAYMQPTLVEFWSASVNNRASATKIGESNIGVLVHSGLSAAVTRYYWARAVDPQGNAGAYFPVSATAGIAGTTLTTAPGPNSVGTTELQNGAVTSSKISVGSLSAISANIGSVTAGSITSVSISSSSIASASISGGSIDGTTVTGSLVRTSSSSTRVEMDSSANQLAVYRGGSQVARIGASASGSFLGVMSVFDTGGTNGVFSYSTGGSASAVQAFRSGSGNAFSGINDSSAAGADVVRAENTAGGIGFLGVGPAAGGYGVYANRGGYGPFTGAHDALIRRADAAQPGDIVCDLRILVRLGWDDTLSEVTLASEVRQAGAVGVVSTRRPMDAEGEFASLPLPRNGDKATFLRRWLAGRFDRLRVNGVGEGQVAVCGRGGDIQRGDLICSSDMPGKGQRQNTRSGRRDNTQRAFTVARAREAVTFENPDDVRRVACIYLCG